MQVNSVSSSSNVSKTNAKKKIAGATAVVAGISAIAAYKSGKKTAADDVKFFGKIAEGYKNIGFAIKNKVTGIFSKKAE